MLIFFNKSNLFLDDSIDNDLPSPIPEPIPRNVILRQPLKLALIGLIFPYFLDSFYFLKGSAPNHRTTAFIRNHRPIPDMRIFSSDLPLDILSTQRFCHFPEIDGGIPHSENLMLIFILSFFVLLKVNIENDADQIRVLLKIALLILEFPN